MYGACETRFSQGVNGEFGGPTRRLQGCKVAILYCLKLGKLGCRTLVMQISVALPEAGKAAVQQFSNVWGI